MPPNATRQPDKSLEQVVAEIGTYPLEAFVFLHEGLAHTIRTVHGEQLSPDQNMHVSGQQLSEGLREYALLKYGMLARAVLTRWGIEQTLDFGRMVYALIDAGQFSRQESDSLDDFRDVYDFSAAFDPLKYQIKSPA